MRKLVVPLILTVVISYVLIAFVLPGVQWTPALASDEGQIVDDLLGLEFAIIAAIFSLCMVFLFYSIIVFRHKEGGEAFGDSFHENLPLEIGWTLVPLGIVLALAVYVAGLHADMIDSTGYDMEVQVTATQWSWRFDYPEQGITSSELVLPEGAKVLFTLTSSDVIHSFWVPEFRLKQDVVPGIETQLVITPNEIGEYRVRCAELCGQDHSIMYADVNVMSKADFDVWVNDSTFLSEDPVERGTKWAEDFGCTACHSVDGSVLVGPSWLGLYGSTEMLEGDIPIEVTEEYLRESIIDPGVKVVDDFANVMPATFGDQLTPAQIDDLIAYIKSLGEE